MTPAGYPVFGANGQIGWYDDYNHDRETVLITCRGATCGTINVCPPKSYVTGNAMALDDLDTHRVDIRFLVRALTPEILRKAITGSAQPQITRESLRGVSLRLPPLDEQRRIAAILDQADALRDKNRQVLHKVDALAKSIFHRMFGASGSHLIGAEVMPLGEAFEIKSGVFLPAKHQDGGSFPVFGGNGVNGYHSEYMFGEPKVVIGRVGAYCGAVHLTPPNAWITDNALYVSAFKRDLNLTYLRDALAVANLNQYASQSGQPLISGSRIKQVSLIIPSIEAQAVYSRRIDLTIRKRDEAVHKLQLIDDLFKSLQSRAFLGEL